MITALLRRPAFLGGVFHLGLISMAIWGCGDDAEGCVPNEQVECACPDGQAGLQVCNGEGTAFSACECSQGLGDGGTDTDDDAAEPDAEADAEADAEMDGDMDAASDDGSTDVDVADASEPDSPDAASDGGEEDAVVSDAADASDSSEDVMGDADSDPPMMMGAFEPPGGLGEHDQYTRTGDMIDMDDATLIDESTAAAPDFSCLGSRLPPMGGRPVEMTLTLTNFQSSNPAVGVCVEVYPDNMPAADDRCEGSVTNEAGEITAAVPSGGEIAYRAFVDGREYVNTIGANIPTPMRGGALPIQTVSTFTRNLVPTVLGVNNMPGTDMIIGRVSDCGGNQVYGVEVRVFDASGDLVIEPRERRGEDPFYRYFNGASFPNATQRYTHIDGLFIVGNLAPSAYTVEVWGRLRAEGPLRLLSCERTRSLPDGVSFVVAHPRGGGARCASRRRE